MQQRIRPATFTHGGPLPSLTSFRTVQSGRPVSSASCRVVSSRSLISVLKAHLAVRVCFSCGDQPFFVNGELLVDHRVARSRVVSAASGSLDLITRPRQQKAHIAVRAVWAKFLFLLEF
jgi:hypothetical protein